MRKYCLWVICSIFALSFTSCVPTSNLYSWYNYEDATYQYSKKQTDELQQKVLELYQKMIDKPNALRKTVPPGLYAEYGYLLIKNGRKDEGLSMLKQEIAIYPESESYISRIINQMEK